MPYATYGYSTGTLADVTSDTSTTATATTSPGVAEIYRRYYAVATSTISKQDMDIEILLPPEIEYEIILSIALQLFYIIYVFYAYIIRAPPIDNFLIL